MDLKEIIKENKHRNRRRQLLIETIKDLKREWVLYKQIANFLWIEQQRVSRIIGWQVYLSKDIVEDYLTKLWQWAK